MEQKKDFINHNIDADEQQPNLAITEAAEGEVMHQAVDDETINLYFTTQSSVFDDNSDFDATDRKQIFETYDIQQMMMQHDENTSDDLSSEFDEMTNYIDGQLRKPRKKKRRRVKVRRIVVRTYVTILCAVLCVLGVYFGSAFFAVAENQGVDGAELRVDMKGLPHVVGTIGAVDLKVMFPDGENFKKNGVKLANDILRVSADEADSAELTLSYDVKNDTDSQHIERPLQVVVDAVNVNDWESFDKYLTTQIDGVYPAICIQTPFLRAPEMLGVKEKKMSGYNVRNDIYGNGCTLNVFEIVCCRNKNAGGKLSAPYLQGNGPVGGWSAFLLGRKEDDSQIIMQDLHIIGNDMSTEEGGNLYGLSPTIIEKRGLKLFSGYGMLLSVEGETDSSSGTKEVLWKPNFKLKHCILENSHKLIHVRCADMEMEGNIIRNASDTALSFATYSFERSVCVSRNNVIANSLTGGVVFYCYDGAISESNAKESWNELIVEEGSFLDIYNWKPQDGLAFMPETESGAEIANPVAKSEIPKAKYDDLKADVEGRKYIHFAIIKLRTGNGLPKNGSYVTNYQNLRYKTSRDMGYPDGFPLPGIAAAIIKDIDVWGYYEVKDAAVSPTASLDEKTVEKLYEELKHGRKQTAA